MKLIEKGKRLFPWIIKNGYLIDLIVRNPRTPWYIRLLMLVPLAYLFVPADIISDFLPILGQLDDLLVLGYGYLLLFKIIPKVILEECREKAETRMSQINWKRVKRTAVIACICLVFTVVGSIYLLTRLG